MGGELSDPIDDLLTEHDLGYVGDGGSYLAGENSSCDFDVWVSDVARALPVVVAALRAAKVPTETTLTYDQTTVRLGDWETGKLGD